MRRRRALLLASLAAVVAAVGLFDVALCDEPANLPSRGDTATGTVPYLGQWLHRSNNDAVHNPFDVNNDGTKSAENYLDPRGNNPYAITGKFVPVMGQHPVPITVAPPKVHIQELQDSVDVFPVTDSGDGKSEEETKKEATDKAEQQAGQAAARALGPSFLSEGESRVSTARQVLSRLARNVGNARNPKDGQRTTSQSSLTSSGFSGQQESQSQQQKTQEVSPRPSSDQGDADAGLQSKVDGITWFLNTGPFPEPTVGSENQADPNKTGPSKVVPPGQGKQFEGPVPENDPNKGEAAITGKPPNGEPNDKGIAVRGGFTGSEATAHIQVGGDAPPAASQGTQNLG